VSEPTRHAYGEHPAQFGELYRPAGATRPGVVVIVHGGFWRSRYDLSLGRPLARDLSARGYTAWNLEYRRVGAGGGWPATLDDVAAGIDALAGLDVDARAVVLVGHSAGGHLAVWAAGRSRVPVAGVVAQAGVLDLTTAAEQSVGHGAVLELMGGTPVQHPQRYAAADPIARVPLAAPVLCLHSRADDEVPIEQSTAYVAASSKAGGRARLVETSGDHYTLIDPASTDWQLAADALPDWFAHLDAT
jgi:acetyl esterase/lipase